MSFEYDPTHEDVEGYNQWLMEGEIKTLKEQLAALRSQLEEQRERLEGAEATITRTGQRARALLIYTQNGHYGPDHSGLELLREIIDLAANWLTPHAEKDGGE